MKIFQKVKEETLDKLGKLCEARKKKVCQFGNGELQVTRSDECDGTL